MDGHDRVRDVQASSGGGGGTGTTFTRRTEAQNAEADGERALHGPLLASAAQHQRSPVTHGCWHADRAAHRPIISHRAT
jgi:hypothetical protein